MDQNEKPVKHAIAGENIRAGALVALDVDECGATVGQAYALIMERQAAMAAADAEAAETEAAKPARKTAEQVAAIAGGAS